MEAGTEGYWKYLFFYSTGCSSRDKTDKKKDATHCPCKNFFKREREVNFRRRGVLTLSS